MTQTLDAQYPLKGSNVTIMAEFTTSNRNLPQLKQCKKANLTDFTQHLYAFHTSRSKILCTTKKSGHERSIPLEMVMSIAKESYWLSSDDINNYTRMVSLMAPDDVHYVDAGWISHKVLRKETFFSSVFSLENSRYS